MEHSSSALNLLQSNEQIARVMERTLWVLSVVVKQNVQRFAKSAVKVIITFMETN